LDWGDSSNFGGTDFLRKISVILFVYSIYLMIKKTYAKHRPSIPVRPYAMNLAQLHPIFQE
jgi:hypothetical protein